MKPITCSFVAPGLWAWPKDVEPPFLLEFDRPGFQLDYEVPLRSKVTSLRGLAVFYEDYDPLIPSIEPTLYIIGMRVFYDIIGRTGKVKVDGRHCAAKMDTLKIRFNDVADNSHKDVVCHVFRVDSVKMMEV